jgi:hypothetical protein
LGANKKCKLNIHTSVYSNDVSKERCGKKKKGRTREQGVGEATRNGDFYGEIKNNADGKSICEFIYHTIMSM